MFSESTAIGSSPIADYSSTDGSVEAQEIVDGGNIEEKNTFSKASRPCRMAYSYVNPSSIIGKHHHPCIALLLLDTIDPTARPGQHKHLDKIDLVFALTSRSISKPNSNPTASPHILFIVPDALLRLVGPPACSYGLRLSRGTPPAILLCSL